MVGKVEGLLEVGGAVESARAHFVNVLKSIVTRKAIVAIMLHAEEKL